LHDSLEQERRKVEVLDERGRSEESARSERKAIEQALAFVRRLLAGLSGPEVESKLVGLAIDALQRLPEQRRSELRAALTTSGEPPVVSTAYPLSSPQRDALSQAVRHMLDGQSELRFREDPALLAGVRISVGPWMLQANLGEELSLFSAAASDGR
jgi:F-type H+-transporting ATPase subunit b